MVSHSEIRHSQRSVHDALNKHNVGKNRKRKADEGNKDEFHGIIVADEKMVYSQHCKYDGRRFNRVDVVLQNSAGDAPVF